MPDEAKQVLPARQYLLDSKLAASATAVSVPWLEIAAAAWKLCKGVLSINSAAHLSQHLHRQLRLIFSASTSTSSASTRLSPSLAGRKA